MLTVSVSINNVTVHSSPKNSRLPYCCHHYQTLPFANIPEDLVSTIYFLFDCFFYTFMTPCRSSSMLRFLAVVCSTQLVGKMHSCLMCEQPTSAFVPNLLLSLSRLPAKEPLHMLLHALDTLLLLLCMSLSFASDAIICYGCNGVCVCVCACASNASCIRAVATGTMLDPFLPTGLPSC